MNMFIVSASSGKNRNFGQILTFLRPPVSTPFYRWGPNLVCYSRPTVYVYLWNFVSISLFCCPVAAKKPQFLPFFWLRQLVMSPTGINLRKLSTGAQLQTFPYPKIVSVLQRLYGEIGRTNSDVQKRDGQTNKQTDKKTQRFWPPRRRVKSEPHPTWHGDRRTSSTFLHLQKLLGVWRTVSLLGGTENLGETRPPQLKTPITP